MPCVEPRMGDMRRDESTGRFRSIRYKLLLRFDGLPNMALRVPKVLHGLLSQALHWDRMCLQVIAYDLKVPHCDGSRCAHRCFYNTGAHSFIAHEATASTQPLANSPACKRDRTNDMNTIATNRMHELSISKGWSSAIADIHVMLGW
jgi:hypothetical protein